MSDKPSWEDYYRVLKGRAEGTIPYNPAGYIVMRESRKDKDKQEPKVCLKQVTPVAGAVERAKSELKAIKESAAPQKRSTKKKRVFRPKEKSYSALEEWREHLKRV